MSRRYDRELYIDRVKMIRSLMPNACIGGDVIVGFPGETDNDFLDTYNFIKKLEINYLHVFPYSERSNTKANKLSDIVPTNIRNERYESSLKITSTLWIANYYSYCIQDKAECLCFTA